jgi:RNA polymerase sigma-70 factor (ECF subfamily)
MITQAARTSAAGGMEGLDDGDLARLLARGEADALTALYDRYGSLAYGVALRLLKDGPAAEDVVQEAFLQVWRHAGSFDSRRGSLRGWLLSMVRNRAIDIHRQRAARPTASWSPDEMDVPDSSDVWAEVRRRMSRETLVRALLHLSPEQREVIELAFFSGYTHVEIADRLNLPLGTVKGRVRLGLQRLRGLLVSPEAERLTIPAV